MVMLMTPMMVMPMVMPMVMVMMVAPPRLGGGSECESARENNRHENSLHGFLP